MADLTEFEDKLFQWILSCDFDQIPWSSEEAAKAFKVDVDEVYVALAALTKKLPNRIQLFYKDGSVHINSE